MLHQLLASPDLVKVPRRTINATSPLHLRTRVSCRDLLILLELISELAANASPMPTCTRKVHLRARTRTSDNPRPRNGFVFLSQYRRALFLHKVSTGSNYRPSFNSSTLVCGLMLLQLIGTPSTTKVSPLAPHNSDVTSRKPLTLLHLVASNTPSPTHIFGPPALPRRMRPEARSCHCHFV